MPEAWAKLLQHSGISAAEKKKNPQGVIKALEFYTATSSAVGDGESKFMTAQRYNDGREDWCFFFFVTVRPVGRCGFALHIWLLLSQLVFSMCLGFG